MNTFTIKDCIRWADDNDGYCLSLVYTNMHSKLKWKCKEGHVWEAKPVNVKNGNWCRICSNNKNKLSLSCLKKQLPKGAELLSEKYTNSKQKLHWKCQNNHEWFATWDSIRAGKWCPYCAGNNKKNIKEMREIAAERGGKCLSSEYKNIKSHLTWECADGHVWEASPEKVLLGRWCHYCNNSFGERICRSFFEQFFKKKFNKIRPDWLVNGQGNRMELDGYCPEINLAFEHHGLQHYELTYYSKNKKALLKRKKDDLEKRRLCKQRGVTLIEIPQISSQIKGSDLKKIIFKELIKHNINIYNSFVFDMKKVHQASKLEEFKELAREKKGQILSKQYINSRVKLKVKCCCGRVWSAWPDNLKKGHWCASCSAKGKK